MNNDQFYLVTTQNKKKYKLRKFFGVETSHKIYTFCIT